MYGGFDYEVFGKVQGVFFRKHTEEKAKELGLVGWVMNTPEGTVVGQAQGDPKALQIMRKWLQEEGSPKSRIDRCEFKNEQEGLDKLDFTDFGVKRPKKARTASSRSDERKGSKDAADATSEKATKRSKKDASSSSKKKKKKTETPEAVKNDTKS